MSSTDKWSEHLADLGEVNVPELTRVGMNRRRALGFEAGRAQAVQDLAERSALMDELREMGLPLPGGGR